MILAFESEDSVDWPPRNGWASLSHRGPEQNKRLEEEEFSPCFPASLIEHGHFISYLIFPILELGFTPAVPLVLKH